MATKNDCNCGCAVCNPEKVMCITQVDSSRVLDPENVGKRDSIMLVSKNMNGVWTLNPLPKVTLNAVVEAMENRDAAFILMEWKEPAEEPPTPGEPDTPTDPGTGENPDNTGDSGTTGGESPAVPDTGDQGETENVE